MTRTAATSRVMLGLLIAATGIWGALARSISGPHDDAARMVLAAAFAVAAVAPLLA